MICQGHSCAEHLLDKENTAAKTDKENTTAHISESG